jgi:hypothetical protein
MINIDTNLSNQLNHPQSFRIFQTRIEHSLLMDIVINFLNID